LQHNIGLGGACVVSIYEMGFKNGVVKSKLWKIIIFINFVSANRNLIPTFHHTTQKLDHISTLINT
jgi:hypothetical protein